MDHDAVISIKERKSSGFTDNDSTVQNLSNNTM